MDELPKIREACRVIQTSWYRKKAVSHNLTGKQSNSAHTPTKFPRAKKLIPEIELSLWWQYSHHWQQLLMINLRVTHSLVTVTLFRARNHFSWVTLAEFQIHPGLFLQPRGVAAPGVEGPLNRPWWWCRFRCTTLAARGVCHSWVHGESGRKSVSWIFKRLV